MAASKFLAAFKKHCQPEAPNLNALNPIPIPRAISALEPALFHEGDVGNSNHQYQ